MNVVVVDDDQGIVSTLTAIFQVTWPNAKVFTSNSGKPVRQLVEKCKPDVIILDVGLPDISGFELIKQIRTISEAPILVLSVHGSETDIVTGLENGANDYLTKPFKSLELMARVKALVRKPKNRDENLAAYGLVKFGSSIRDVVYKGRAVSVTVNEGRVLSNLIKAGGRVVSVQELADDLWHRTDRSSIEELKTYVYRLRLKLEDEPHHPKLILSKPGVGYYLSREEEPVQ
jgi:two-component system, OmpR family, response regulator VicR